MGPTLNPASLHFAIAGGTVSLFQMLARRRLRYHLGRLAVGEPEAYFHIISLDKGYDPLVEHLKAHGVHTTRCADVKDIPILKTADTAASHMAV